MGLSSYHFSKSEKLTGKKSIEELFKKGSSFYLDNFQIRYLSVSNLKSHQVLISVPKRNFKKAVDRNLLKRRIREAYRLNKQIIYNNYASDFLYIGFVYLSKEKSTFRNIQAQLIKCLKRLENIKAERHE